MSAPTTHITGNANEAQFLAPEIVQGAVQEGSAPVVHDADTRSKFDLYKTARLTASGELVALRYFPPTDGWSYGAFFTVTTAGGHAFGVWPDELFEFCL